LIIDEHDLVVEFKNNIVYLNYLDSLSIDKLVPILAEVEEIIKDVEDPVHLVADITKLNNISIESRKYGIEWTRSTKINKIAVFGGNVFMKHLINLIIMASGRKENFRIFKTKHEAEEWILNH